MPPSKRHRALSHSAAVCTGDPATGMCPAGSNRMGGQARGLGQSEENMTLHVPDDFSGVKKKTQEKGRGWREGGKEEGKKGK